MEFRPKHMDRKFFSLSNKVIGFMKNYIFIIYTVCASNIWTLFFSPTFSVLKRQKRTAVKHRFQRYFLC